MEDGPPIFSQSFTCSDLLFVDLVLPLYFRVRDYHPLSSNFPECSPNTKDKDYWLVPFRSPLLRESRLISFPPGTEMFHFPGYRLDALCIQTPMTPHNRSRVFPFGNLRIKAYLPLPEAYRSLPRPSSPRIAKASTYCP